MGNWKGVYPAFQRWFFNTTLVAVLSRTIMHSCLWYSFTIETDHHIGTTRDYYYRTGPAVPRRLESLTRYLCHCNVGPDFLCRLYFKILWIKKSLLLLLLFVFHYVFCWIAYEQQTYFRSSLLSLRKMTSDLIGQHQNKRFSSRKSFCRSGSQTWIFRRERSDDRKYVCCSQAIVGRTRVISVLSTDSSVNSRSTPRSLYRPSVGRHSL